MGPFITPFDPGDAVVPDYSSPLWHGCVWATHLADGSSGASSPVGGSKDLHTGRGLSSGLIHASATPFGRGRNRTDGSSPFVFNAFERHAFQTGDFTCAAFGRFSDQGVAVNAVSHTGASNQWRILVHYNGSAYESGAACLFTFDGASTLVAASGVFSTNKACWLVGVRRGTTHQLWRDSVLVASATGTARDATSATSGAPQVGFGTANSTGLLGPALLWRRALTGTEIALLSTGPTPYAFMPRMPRRLANIAVDPTFLAAWAAGANHAFRA